MAKNENIFTRLTTLFRSGPVVKRRVREYKPSDTSSSAYELFRKTQSNVYSTAMSAYGAYDRMARYSDFQEMEYSLHGDTLIASPEAPDGFFKISELADLCKNDPEKTFVVYAYDHENRKIVPALGKQARQTCVDHAWKVTFENGQTIIASPEHRLMMRDGTYRKVEDLQAGDSLMPFYRKDLFENAQEGTKGYRWIYTMDKATRGWTKEHQLIASWIEGRSLLEDEVVHHINFVKTDNRPQNLLIMKKSDHDSYHASLNNRVKWSIENQEWIEGFKGRHAQWMRDNTPTKRNDITFSRILETCERHGFRISAVRDILDVSEQLINERLVANGFSSFTKFADAYRDGLIETYVSNDKTGLLTRDLDLDLVKMKMAPTDTKRSLSVKLGCSVNVLDKFLNRRAQITWTDLREQMGYGGIDSNHRRGGRPKGRPAVDPDVTYQRICSAYTPGMTLPRLAHRLNTTKNVIMSRLATQGISRYSEWTQHYQNHKIVSVEYVGIHPLYDLTVDGYKNFATDTVISHNTPEIASALDIYSEESVSPDEKGNCLHVYSENAQIHRLLNELFFDTLNVNFNMTSWVRNICKYGDFFLFNDVSPEHGVINVFPISVNEIEREEGFDRQDPLAVRYRWVTQGNQVLQNWQVSHFRLLGNDAFLPYGTSVLEAARRIWRQLILVEDAMLVYRIIRAPDRRVFYVDVGNVPPEEIPNYMEQAQSTLKKNQVIDRATGRVDLRYNPMPVHKDTPIPLLDGTTMTIEALSAKMTAEPSWTPWVYSVQDETSRVVPGKVIWCGKNYTASTLTRVWLDDGSYITTAPEHPYVMRDGTSKRADALGVGDSLMSAYRDLNNRGYERIVEPNGDLTSTHVMTARDAHKDKWESTLDRVVHHKRPERGEINKRDNTPDNLEVMNFWEHRKMHAEHCEKTLNRPDLLAARRVRRIEYNKSPEKRARTSQLNKQLGKARKMGQDYNGSDLHRAHNQIRRDAQLASWNDDKQARATAMQWIIPNEVVAFVFDQIKRDPKIGRDDVTAAVRNNHEVMNLLKEANASNNRDVTKFHVSAIAGKLNRMGCITSTGYSDLKKYAASNPAPVNHQVVRVETITDACDDVYCMTVVGPRGEDDRHNFAVNGLDELSDKKVNSLIFLLNSVDEDYFIPVRGGQSGTKVENLGGGTNAAAIEDVQYIQKKLFSALKIPKAYLGYDEGLGAKATLSQEDIRFSRSINRIQRTIISELNKLAIVHLYCNGFDSHDLLDFELKLTNPSTIAQQQKLELFTTKFTIAQAASGIENLVNKKWIKKNVFMMSDEEIEEIEKGLFDDKKLSLKLEAVKVEPVPGEAEAAGEMGGLEVPPSEPAAAPEAPAPEAPNLDLGAGGPITAGDARNPSRLPLISEFDDDIDLTRVATAKGLPLKAFAGLTRTNQTNKKLLDEKTRLGPGYAEREIYNASRRKKGSAGTRTHHADLASHDRKDPRDSIAHPYGEKKDLINPLKDAHKVKIDETDDFLADYLDDKLNDAEKRDLEVESILRSLGKNNPKSNTSGEDK